MKKLTREDLYSLEKYAELRADFRRQVMEHKQDRRLAIGPNATLYFEDRLTIQYQVQEMLRVERLFESRDIEDELAAYNPLIPDGRNWKATFMLEFEDAVERRTKLAELIGVESQVWMQVEGHDRIIPLYNEDLERSTEAKTSSVHFMRFELAGGMAESVNKGATLAAGIDHSHYSYTVDPVPKNILQSLAQDLD